MNELQANEIKLLVENDQLEAALSKLTSCVRETKFEHVERLFWMRLNRANRNFRLGLVTVFERDELHYWIASDLLAFLNFLLTQNNR